MNQKTFIVPTISCGHCTNTIQMELGELEGVTAVTASQETKQVHVEWNDTTNWEQINALLHEINYPPQQLIQL